MRSLKKIAVASGKGGTGKTFIATNLFLTFIHENDRVVLADCDTEVPNSHFFFQKVKESEKKVSQYLPHFDLEKCTYCGRCMDYCEYNAIFCLPEQKKLKLLTNLCHGCKACEIACKEKAITQAENIVGKVSTYITSHERYLIEGRMKEGAMSSVPVIKETLKGAESINADYMIIDAPPGTSCPFINTVADVDLVVLVTEPTPFGLSDLRQAIETLKILKKDYVVIINRSGLGEEEIYHYIRAERASLIAEIPFNKNIAHYYSQGFLAVEKEQEIAQLFKNIRKEILKTWK